MREGRGLSADDVLLNGCVPSPRSRLNSTSGPLTFDWRQKMTRLPSHQKFQLQAERTTNTFFWCCFFFLHKHRREPSTRLFDVSWGKKPTQTHTVGPSGLVSAVKALLSHRLMCFEFSTSCKWKQSAHIQDNQKIFKRKKVTHNPTKASQTCSGRTWRRSCQRRYQLPEQGGGREGDGALAGGAKLPDKTT